MAHVDKYHIGAIGHLFKHYERAKDNDGNYIKFKNQNIDLTKTGGNYNLAAFQPLPQLAFIRKRLSEVKVFKRSDVKVMCDWVVTLPKNLGKDERRFFEETVNFLSERYGRQNVISAYVHRDETQPHLHFAFVPVTVDRKKGIEKVSAKEVLTRAELQRFHTDLDNYLASVFGRSTGVLNDATKEGNKSIADLKRGAAVKDLREKREELTAVEKRIDGLQWGERIKPVKEKSNTVVISKADYKSANDAKVKRCLLETRARESEEKAAKAVNRDYQKELFQVWEENRKLRAEQSSLVAEKARLKNELAGIQNVFDASPKFWESFLQLAAELERITEREERAAQAERRARRQLEKGELQM
jgi:hypothetical protein